MDLNKEEILSNRGKIIELLKSVNRDGIDTLIKFMDKSKYFFCWGSLKHHKYVGGLAEHSLGVYNLAISHNKDNCPKDSVIIASLLHDMCKVYYDFPPEHQYNGHGSKSVKIIENFVGFRLTDEERRAIRFHLGIKSHIANSEDELEFNLAKKESLWHLIHVSDCVDAGGYSPKAYNVVETFLDTFKF